MAWIIPTAPTAAVLSASYDLEPKIRWNVDILGGILSDIEGADNLYHAALVCWDWALAARIPLYQRLVCNTNRRSAPLLTRTLRSCPHLCVLVRHLTLNLFLTKRDVTILDWLKLLPEHSLHGFDILASEEDQLLAQSILHLPCIQTIRHFKGRGKWISSESLPQCFQLRHLKSLSLDLPYNLRPSIFALENATSHFSSFHLTIPQYYPFISQCLAMFGRQLERFEVLIRSGALEGSQITELITAFRQHTPHLRHFTAQTYWKPAFPFLDDVMEYAPPMTHLYCGNDSPISARFERVLPELRQFELEEHAIVEFPPSEALQPVANTRRAKSRLHTISVHRRADGACGTWLVEALVSGCKDGGFRFLFGPRLHYRNVWILL